MTTFADLMTEDQFKDKVIALAAHRGWFVHHDRPARTKEGGRWLTHIQGNAGFPDLVLARAGVVIFAELKSTSGRVSPSQHDWLEELTPAGHPNPSHHAYVWKPSDMPQIEGVLR